MDKRGQFKIGQAKHPERRKSMETIFSASKRISQIQEKESVGWNNVFC